MEFELGIDAVCNFMEGYERIMQSLIDDAKSAEDVTNQLIDTNWSGAAKEQYEKNMAMWQKQMGKFIEDMQKINDSFAGILNVTSIQLQEKCDAFEELIKK